MTSKQWGQNLVLTLIALTYVARGLSAPPHPSDTLTPATPVLSTTTDREATFRAWYQREGHDSGTYEHYVRHARLQNTRNEERPSLLSYEDFLNRMEAAELGLALKPASLP